jgi:glycosyltransferase involved in cell wall biosynthesis
VNVSTAKSGVSILIISYNEELNLPDCLASVCRWSDDVWVVDAFSTDNSVALARNVGAQVVQHEFRYPAQQKNWALDNLPFRHEWLLMIDADERVPAQLREEIDRVVARDGDGHDGFWMPYRLIFYGKWIRHCGWYPTWILRLVRHTRIRWEDRPVDEHPVLQGSTGRLEHDLIHESLRDLEFWIAKHNGYSTQNAALYARGQADTNGVRSRFFGTQAERKRFIKQRIWRRLPGRSLWFFVYMYVFRAGFLDGMHGFRFCLMHAIFQEFISMKLWELKRYKQGAPAGGINGARVFHDPLARELDGARK